MTETTPIAAPSANSFAARALRYQQAASSRQQNSLHGLDLLAVFLPSTPGPLPDLLAEIRGGKTLTQAFQSLGAEQRKAVLGGVGELRLSELLSLTQNSSGIAFWQEVLHFGRRLKLDHEMEKAAGVFSLLAGDTVPEEIRRQAARELDSVLGRGHGGMRAEVLLSGLAREASNYRTILPMVAGSVVGRTVGTAVWGRLLGTAEATWVTRGFGARFAAGTVGYLAEVPTFAFSARALNPSPGSVTDDLSRAALTIGALRAFSWAGNQLFLKAHGFNEFAVPTRLAGLSKFTQAALPQASIFTGLMAAHGLEEKLGLRPAVDGATTVTDTLAAMLSMGVGSHLGQRALGPRFAEFQQEIGTRAQFASRREVSSQVEPQYVLASAGRGLSGKKYLPPEIFTMNMASGEGNGKRNPIEGGSSGGGRGVQAGGKPTEPGTEGGAKFSLSGLLGLVRKAEAKSTETLLREALQGKALLGGSPHASNPDKAEAYQALADQYDVSLDLVVARNLQGRSSETVEKTLAQVYGDKLADQLILIRRAGLVEGAPMLLKVLQTRGLKTYAYQWALETLRELGEPSAAPELQKWAEGKGLKRDADTKLKAAVALVHTTSDPKHLPRLEKMLESPPLFGKEKFMPEARLAWAEALAATGAEPGAIFKSLLQYWDMHGVDARSVAVLREFDSRGNLTNVLKHFFDPETNVLRAKIQELELKEKMEAARKVFRSREFSQEVRDAKEAEWDQMSAQLKKLKEDFQFELKKLEEKLGEEGMELEALRSALKKAEDVEARYLESRNFSRLSVAFLYPLDHAEPRMALEVAEVLIHIGARQWLNDPLNILHKSLQDSAFAPTVEGIRLVRLLGLNSTQKTWFMHHLNKISDQPDLPAPVRMELAKAFAENEATVGAEEMLPSLLKDPQTLKAAGELADRLRPGWDDVLRTD